MSTTSAGAAAPPPGSGVTRHGTAVFAFLLLTALTCGSHVMAIEVLGARVVGPYFGVSLFVWTSLITVTLVALATGYAIGGWWADRHPSPDWLYGVVLAAGGAVLLVPPLRQPVLHACLPLGVRAGALVSASLLFGPSLFLLGCVSPYVVRIAVDEVGRLGRMVGLISAVSTGGSFLGTVLTGFVLVTELRLGLVFQLIGALLVALGAAWFLAFRRRPAALGPALLLLALAALPERAAPTSKVLADGTVARQLLLDDGYYAQLRVLEFQAGPVRTRELLMDGQIQGGLDLATGLSVYPYAYGLQHLPWALRPQGRRALVVGLGAGLVPRWYERMGVTTDVVELDPQVVAAARTWFDFSLSGEVVLEDGRWALQQSAPGRYDYLVLDVFGGDTTPGHLLSLEALALADRALAPGGVLAANLIGRLGPDGVALASVTRTLRQVFEQVDLYPLFDPEREAVGNVVAVAYHGPPRALEAARLEGLPVSPLAAPRLPAACRPYRFPPGTPAYLLTDDHQPLDGLDVDVKEGIRAAITSDRADWDMAL